MDTDTRGEVRHGQRVLAKISDGTVRPEHKIIFTFHRIYTPWVANQTEYYHVAVDGAAISPCPTFRVRGGPAEYARLIVPSTVRPGVPFRVLLVSLDRYDNVSSTYYDRVRLTVEDGQELSREFSFQGRSITSAVLEEEGVFRLAAHGLRGDSYLADGYRSEAVISNPVRVAERPNGPYWGDIHVHSHISADAMGNELYQYARDVSGLDFAGVCDHANADLPEQWERIKRWVRECNEDHRFVTILGYEGGDEGIHHSNIYYPNDDIDFTGDTFLQKTQMDHDRLGQHLEETGALSQLHQSGTCNTDMRKNYFPQTKVIEIFSSWGQSEYYNPDHALSYESNRVRYPETRLTISGRGPFYARDAWGEGKRFAAIASSDDHFGQPGKAHRGITGVIASEFTRRGVFEGLHTGSCYATTGERVLLDFRANGLPMGSELSLNRNKEVEFTVEVHGTDVLCSVEVFRHRFGPGETSVCQWESAFHRDIPDVGLKGTAQRDLTTSFTEAYVGPTVYYLRVRQKYFVKDRPVYAWSTPIWLSDA